MKKPASPRPASAASAPVPSPSSVPTPALEAAAPGFRAWLRQPAQRRDLWLLGGLYAALYALVHYCYPYPLITEDSPNYVYCAITDVYGGFRPMGYSWFLQWVHALSARIVFVGAAQFWLHAACTAFFLLSVKYLFPPRRPWVFYLFALGTMLSPVALYLTHWLMSDSPFASLTLLWLGTGLFLLRRVNWLVAAVHVAVMIFAIQLRFVGLFYPFFTAAGLLLAHGWRGGRAWAVAAASLFGAYFVYHNVKRETYRLYGIESFSGFSGWAAANNAAAMLPHVKLPLENLANDPELQFVHATVSVLPDTCYNVRRIVRTSFIWNKGFGGKLVLDAVRQQMPGNYPGAWIYTGELLDRYASYLRRHYPLEFARYFLLMNVGQTLKPSLVLYPKYREVAANDVFAEYYDTDGVDRFRARYDLVGLHLQPLLAPACLVLWGLIAAASVVVLLRRRDLAMSRWQRLGVWWLLGYAAVYLGASLIAHPVHLRYLLPIHALQIFVLYLAANALLTPRRSAGI